MTEHMPVPYGKHEPIAPGTPCLLCGSTVKQPVMDHCHEHGWTRGPLCPQCNALMMFIDRRISVRESALVWPVTLAVLVKHATRCPDCEPFSVNDLGPTQRIGLRPAAAPAMITLNARIPDELHAKLKALAGADRRSLNSMMIVLIEREYERLIKMGA